MTVVDWLLDSDPVDPLAGHARPDGRAGLEAVAGGAGDGSRPTAGVPRCWRCSAPTATGATARSRRTSTNTFNALELLRILGLDPASPEARRAVGLVAEHVTWGDGAEWKSDWASNGFFEGEVEPCINGNVLATGAYFGQDMRSLVDRLLGEQLADGGWNCEVENGATVSSFGTTINVLEGLLAYRARDRRRRPT